jgi:hypothetical protein
MASTTHAKDDDANRKRKRTNTESADKATEDDEEESSNIHTKRELDKWADTRGIKNRETRIRSVTSSMDACVREDIPGKDSLLHQIDKDARSLGILRHLVSVCLNALAEKDPSNPLIFNRTFIQQLFTRMSGNELNNRATKLEHPDLNKYLEEHAMDEDTIREVKNFPLRCRDAMCGEMLSSIKKHVSGNFGVRATEHIACELERRLWSFRDDQHFWTNLSGAANRLYVSAGHKTLEKALSMIHAFTNKKRGKSKDQLRPEWRQVLEDLLPEYRALFETLRSTRPPPKNPPKNPKTEEQMTGMEDFFYNVKAKLNDVLKIEAVFRESDFNLRQRRGEIWSEISERQPSIKPSKTKEGFVNQQHLLLAVPRPSWIDDDVAEMSKKDASKLLRDVSNARKEMWKVMREPGTENPPKSFSLLPHFSLTRAFVKYDDYSIGTLAKSLQITGEGPNLKTEGVANAGRSKRLWWSGIFDFHTERVCKRRPKTRKRPTSGRRKVLRAKNRFRKGISVCTKDPWFTDELLYMAKREDPACTTPWLVNSISTDGLQVKVCLATLAKTEPLPRGIKELVKKGYSSLPDVGLNFSRFSKGVFSKAKKLSNKEKSAMSTENSIEVVGLDPGQVSIYATVRANVISADVTSPEGFTSSSFKGSKASFSSREYSHQSLSRFSAKAETRRREQNVGYGQAIQAYDPVSLKQPGLSSAYADVTYSTLSVRINELLSEGRRLERFARLRARQRAVDGMAKDIAYGNSYKNEVRRVGRSSKEKMSPERRRELLRKIRDKKRVVFFGNGQFGHGARGPCPRKALVRALGVLCPVLMVDEFRTSKCCCGCGTPLKQVDGSRVFRCESQTDEGRACPVGKIDRDTNGSVNIGVCGVHQLLGLERPSYLCRSSSGD